LDRHAEQRDLFERIETVVDAYDATRLLDHGEGERVVAVLLVDQRQLGQRDDRFCGIRAVSRFYFAQLLDDLGLRITRRDIELRDRARRSGSSDDEQYLLAECRHAAILAQDSGAPQRLGFVVAHRRY
jgi:hypothetical protein